MTDPTIAQRVLAGIWLQADEMYGEGSESAKEWQREAAERLAVLGALDRFFLDARIAEAQAARTGARVTRPMPP